MARNEAFFHLKSEFRIADLWISIWVLGFTRHLTKSKDESWPITMKVKMLQLISYLLLAFSSLPVLALPTNTDITTTLDKPVFELPNAWHLILQAHACILQPVSVSSKPIKALYRFAVSYASSQLFEPLDHSASFKIGSFMLAFTGNPENDKPLDWSTVIEFCWRMRQEALLGPPFLVMGWLVNRNTEEWIYVNLGFVQEKGGSLSTWCSA